MAGKIKYTHGRAVEIMIELSKGNLSTNRLIDVLDGLGTYDTYPQRTNVCGYLRKCREAGMVKTRKMRKATIHEHSLTDMGQDFLNQLRNDARVE